MISILWFILVILDIAVFAWLEGIVFRTEQQNPKRWSWRWWFTKCWAEIWFLFIFCGSVCFYNAMIKVVS